MLAELLSYAEADSIRPCQMMCARPNLSCFVLQLAVHELVCSTPSPLRSSESRQQAQRVADQELGGAEQCAAACARFHGITGPRAPGGMKRKLDNGKCSARACAAALWTLP